MHKILGSFVKSSKVLRKAELGDGSLHVAEKAFASLPEWQRMGSACRNGICRTFGANGASCGKPRRKRVLRASEGRSIMAHSLRLVIRRAMGRVEICLCPA